MKKCFCCNYIIEDTIYMCYDKTFCSNNCRFFILKNYTYSNDHSLAPIKHNTKYLENNSANNPSANNPPVNNPPTNNPQVNNPSTNNPPVNNPPVNQPIKIYNSEKFKDYYDKKTVYYIYNTLFPNVLYKSVHYIYGKYVNNIY